MASSMLNYVTYKYVVIKDYRIGISYYLLAAGIILYMLFEIILNKGYLEIDNKPQGVVRIVVSDDLLLVDQSTLPYCTEGALRNISCRFDTPQELNWPVETRSVTITTFAKDKLQQATGKSPQNDNYEMINETCYFTMDPEKVVIKVDHTVVASRFGSHSLAASKRQMKGHLLNPDGTINRQLSVPGKPDKISLQELLEAGGVVSLDQPSDSVNSKGKTIRERGMILQVTIYYQNWFKTWFGTSDIEYEYHVRRIPYMDYNSKQLVPLPQSCGTDNVLRLLRKRYSIRVEFEQSGSLGMFSFSTLTLKLVSGIGLLALTATIIDTLVLYVLPNKDTYRRLVYEDVKKRQ